MLPGQSQDNVRTKIGRPGQYQVRGIFPGQCQDKDNSGQFFVLCHLNTFENLDKKKF